MTYHVFLSLDSLYRAVHPGDCLCDNSFRGWILRIIIPGMDNVIYEPWDGLWRSLYRGSIIEIIVRGIKNGDFLSSKGFRLTWARIAHILFEPVASPFNQRSKKCRSSLGLLAMA